MIFLERLMLTRRQNDRVFTMCSLIEAEETRRVIIDGRQAQALFGAEIPATHRHKVRLPFERVYIELTEGIDYFQEVESTSYNGVPLTPDERNPARLSLRAIYVEPLSRPGLSGLPTARHYVTMLSTQYDSDGVVRETSFDYDATTGQAFHERTDAGFVRDLAGLLFGLCAYMMVKSVRIVRYQPETRAERRRLAANRRIPQPWHVVRVEPRIQDGSPIPEEIEIREHGYRYDVIGHLRFGKHKRADGTYSHTIEWVRPHQRGLRHELYIPKTSHFRRRGKIAPEMGEYWR